MKARAAVQYLARLLWKGGPPLTSMWVVWCGLVLGWGCWAENRQAGVLGVKGLRLRCVLLITVPVHVATPISVVLVVIVDIPVGKAWPG